MTIDFPLCASVPCLASVLPGARSQRGPKRRRFKGEYRHPVMAWGPEFSCVASLRRVLRKRFRGGKIWDRPSSDAAGLLGMTWSPSLGLRARSAAVRRGWHAQRSADRRFWLFPAMSRLRRTLRRRARLEAAVAREARGARLAPEPPLPAVGRGGVNREVRTKDARIKRKRLYPEVQLS